MVGAVKQNFVPLESESAIVPKCAQVHGVPTSRIANVKHGPESCLVEAVSVSRVETGTPGGGWMCLSETRVLVSLSEVLVSLSEVLVSGS